MSTSERIDGPGRNGGLYSIAQYSDKHNVPCRKANAYNVEITEYNAEHVEIGRTYGEVKPAQTFAVRNFRKTT